MRHGHYYCQVIIIVEFDSVQVVVKFIRKSKVSAESWVETEDQRRLPSEVSLLLNLHHPNIVKVLLQCYMSCFTVISAVI